MDNFEATSSRSLGSSSSSDDWRGPSFTLRITVLEVLLWTVSRVPSVRSVGRVQEKLTVLGEDEWW
jgi:hypothetical protein